MFQAVIGAIGAVVAAAVLLAAGLCRAAAQGDRVLERAQSRAVEDIDAA